MYVARTAEELHDLLHRDLSPSEPAMQVPQREQIRNAVAGFIRMR